MSLPDRFARSAWVGLISSIFLFGVFSISLGLDAFDAEAHRFYGADTDPHRAPSLWSYVLMSLREWDFVIRKEPAWMLSVSAAILWVTNTLSISTVQDAARRLKSNDRLGMAWARAAGCLVLAIAGTAILVAAIMARPYQIVLFYHDYQAATSAFWFWSVAPAASLLPLLTFAGVSCIGTLRFLRKRLRTESSRDQSGSAE